MCNGESTRIAQGGTIAILKPTLESSDSSNVLRPALRRDLSLRLTPTISGEDEKTTTATIDGLEQFISPSLKKGYFVIHRTGDLRHTAQGHLAEESILHRFAVPGSATDSVPFRVEGRLDLGVGGEGMIGRRVSFWQGRRVLGEGIIGWN